MRSMLLECCCVVTLTLFRCCELRCCSHFAIAAAIESNTVVATVDAAEDRFGIPKMKITLLLLLLSMLLNRLRNSEHENYDKSIDRLGGD